MRTAKWVCVCAVLALIVPACGKKDKSGGSKKKAPPSAEELKAKQEAAIKAAKAPALAAFDKSKGKFRACDLKRLDALTDMKWAIKYKRSNASALKKLKVSRRCLLAWWQAIDAALKPQKIKRNAWMPHFLKWKDGVMKIALTAAKPLAGGTAHKIKGTNKKTWVSFTAPEAWKPVEDKTKKKKRRKRKKKKKGELSLKAENITCDVKIEFESKAKPLSEVLKRQDMSSGRLMAKMYKVKGLNGVLTVTYTTAGGGITELLWQGELDVHPKHRFGDLLKVRVLHNKTPWATKAQLQQFVDMLAAIKFNVEPRKK